MKFNKFLAWFLLISLNLSPVTAFAARTPEAAKDAVWVNQVFQKGKTFYEAGDYKSAVREWNSLDPYLDQYPSFQKVINYLKSQISSPSPGSSAAVPVRVPPAVAGPPLEAPPEFKAALADAQEKLKVRQHEIEAAGDIEQKNRVFEEAWINDTFKKGQIAFDQGNVDGAIEEWDKLIFKLNNDPELKEQIEDLKASYRELQDAKAPSAAKPSLVDRGNMKQVFSLAEAQLKLKTDKAAEESRSLSSTLEERQKWVNLTFDKGKTFYQDGRHKEAMDQWMLLAPYFENDEELRSALLSARASLTSYEKAQAAALPDPTGGARALSLPEDFKTFLETAGHQLSRQAREIEFQKEKSEEAVQSKEKDVTRAFESGKNFYIQGMVPEAIAAWKKILPSLDNAAEVEGLLNKVEAGYQASAKEKAALQQLQGRSESYFAPPAKLTELLRSANQDLQNQVEAATDQRVALEKGSRERDAWIAESLQKASTAYRTGRTDAAIEEWNKLVSYLDPASEEKAQIESLKKNYFDFQEAKKQNKEALDKKGIKLQLPDNFKKTLSEANQDLIRRVSQTRLEREALERNLIDRQAWITATFQKGKALYDAGGIDAAIAEWKKIQDYLDENSSARVLIQQADSNYQDYWQAKHALDEASSKKDSKFEPPIEFPVLLKDASDRVKKETAEAQAEKTKTEKDLADRQAWVNATFEAGKAQYQQGKISEALQEWDKLRPYLNPNSGVSADLSGVKAAQDNALQAKSEAVEAMSMQNRGVGISEDLVGYLKDALAQLETQTLQNKKQKSDAQTALAEKQKAAELTAERGKLFYQNKDLDRAIREWQALLPYLDKGSSESKLIESLKQNYDAWLDAQKASQSAQSALDEKIQVPAGFSEFLTSAIDQLKAQANQAQLQREKSAETLKSRQAFVDNGVQSGKSLYEKGDLKGALDQWSSLAPSLEDPQAKMIQSAQQIYEQSKELQKDADLAQSRSGEKLKAPADLSKTVSDAVQKIKSQTQEALARRESAKQTVADRQLALNSSFERGKLFLQAGNMEEALKQWSALAPDLDDADSRELIDSLNRNYESLLETQKAAEEIEARKNARFKAPEDLFKLLENANSQITKDSQTAQLQHARLQKEVSDREASFSEAFQNGKSLLAQGKRKEAIYEWDKLIPYLDEKSGIKEVLESSKKNLQMMEEAEKSNELFAANEYRQLKMPFGDELTKLLSAADSQIQSDLLKAKNQRSDMEKALTDRQAWAGATFEKGKAYYEVGKFKEALEFWSSLTPVLEKEAEMKSRMDALAQSYQSMMEAKKAAEDASAKKDDRFAAPEGLPALLDELAAKLKDQTLEATSAGAKAEQTYSDRKEALDAIFQKGNVLYQAGNFSEAIKEWSAMPPYLVDEAKVKTLLDNLNQSVQSLAAARQAAADAQARQEARFAAPEGLSDLLLDAARKLDKETQVSELERQRSEKTITERQTSVQGVFAEGKAFYDQGKMNEAFLRWRSLLPSMTDEKELGEQLTKAEQSYQTYVNSKQQNQETLAKKELKVTPPAELSEILDTANRSLGDQIFDMKNRTAQTEKMLEDRKSWVDVTFQKGKLAYNQGRYKEAAAEWNTLMPFIENGDTLKNAIADFERNLQVSMDSSKIVQEAAAKKDSKFQAPEELGVLLMQLNEKVKNEALEAGAEKIKAEQTYSERQKWMDATFAAGKSFYEEGKVGEAIGEWSKLSPFLDDKSGMQKLLDAVKQNYEAATAAKKGAVEATASDYQGLKLPYAEQMSKLLTEADSKLQGEAQRYQAKQQEVEKTLAERQEWSVTTFNKGKVYYDQGQYDEALNQWERLLPYLAEGSDIKTQIQSLRKNYSVVIAGQTAAGGPVGNEKPVTLKNEDEILSVLNDANVKLRSEAEEMHQKAASSEKVIQDRQEWIEYTFQKGKVFYDQGNYAKAVEEWGILGPYLAEHPKVRESIEEAKKNYSEGKMAQKAIESVEAKKSTLLPLPQNAQTPPAPESAAPGAPDDQGKNAQLVSGEIVSIDAGQRTLAMKLYSESGANETLTVSFDESTQVDGSDAKTIASIQSGSNIDLRYNPQTSRAVYIYVY